MLIEGIELIYQTGCVNLQDDLSYPFSLYANFSPPEFMHVAFICAHRSNSEEIIVIGKTIRALEELILLNRLRSHPRLRYIKINGIDVTSKENFDIPERTKDQEKL